MPTETNYPAQPQMYQGGNIVNGVNTRYQISFAQFQSNFTNESNLLQSQNNLLLQKQSDRVQRVSERDEAERSRNYWQEKASQCNIGCGSKWNSRDSEQRRLDAAINNLQALDNEILQTQTQISNFFEPKVLQAREALLKNYSDYEADIAAATEIERKAAEASSAVAIAAQNTQNMNSPAYWAQKAADAKAAAEAQSNSDKQKSAREIEMEKIKNAQILGAKKIESDNKVKTIISVAIAVVIVSLALLVGVKYFKR